MKDYQRKIKNKYILPKEVYNQTVWQIRDYYRLKDYADSILLAAPFLLDGMPKPKTINDDVLKKVLKREEAINIISVIDNELLKIPDEYRDGVWLNIMNFKAYPCNADRTTYARYKSKFIFSIANRLNIV